MMRMGETWSKISVILAVLGAITVNALANILRFGGFTTGEVSALYPTAFTPAGYVFSIWSVIYLGLLALALAQASSRPAAALMKTARVPFVIGCVANAAWIALWHAKLLALSVVVMIVLLVSLVVVYRRFRLAAEEPGAIVRWTMLVPISIYLGWICVATVANVAVWLVSRGVGGSALIDAAWSVLMMLVALAIGGRLAMRFSDPAPTFVLAWAFVGIGVAHPDAFALRVTAFVLGGAALVISLLVVRRVPRGTSASLAGRVVVVTGASRGFGFALCAALAKRGARVVLSSRTREGSDAAAAKLRGLGLEVMACACDVRDRDAVSALGDAAMTQHGRIDVWINNAGISAPYGPVRAIAEAAFLETTRTFVDGVYFGSKTALERFRPGEGMLVNIVGRGERSPVPLQAAYGSAKAWVRNFTLALAEEERSNGHSVLAFQPGLMDTRLVLEPLVLPSYEARMRPLATVTRLFGAPPEVAAEVLAGAIVERRRGYLAAHPWWWMLAGPLRLITRARPPRPIQARIGQPG